MKELEIKCNICNEVIPQNAITSEYIKQDNTIKKCKVCLWKENHPDYLHIEGFSEKEIDRFLRFFLFKESIYLNDIAEILHRPIDDMIKLFRNLHIANRKCMIKTVCDNCGENYECSLANYTASVNHYCCFDCYTNDKTNRIGHGENSQFYNRIAVTCNNCGKIILVIPSRVNETNKFGESHNFCSHKCYSQFRSKYYIGEKSVNYQRKFSDESRQKMSQSCAKSMHLRTHLNSSIQQTVNEYLDSIDVKYLSEYPIKFYSIDNYLPEFNLGIEVMGDYWHVNPFIYNDQGRLINQIQVKDIIRDKKKRTYLIKYNNIHLLYLWEDDLRNRFDVCKLLIQFYIDSNGIIDNYNSFNWDINNNNCLILSSNIVYPYFEIDKKYYQSILKSA